MTSTPTPTPTPAPTPTYEERLQTLDLTPIDELKSILKNSTKVTFLDVRGPEEIAAAPLTLPSDIQKKSNSVSCACSRTDAKELVNAAVADVKPLLPDKDETIIIFCKSGARAKTGKLALEEVGYTKIYNAGGVTDMTFLQNTEFLQETDSNKCIIS